MEDSAVMTDIGLVHIDATTTPSQFARELRWNHAYYRLAHRLSRY
jgi:L-arabinose isomerase